MNSKTARKLLAAVGRVEHGGFLLDHGLTAQADDRVPLYSLAVRKYEVMLQEARACLEHWHCRPQEALEYLASAVELRELLDQSEARS